MVFKRSKEKILSIRSINKTNKLLFPYRLNQYIKYLENRRALIKILEKERERKKRQMQFPKNAAIIFMGTKNYINYFPRYYQNVKHLFLPNTKKCFFVFTDRINEPFLKKEDICAVKIKHEGLNTMRFPYRYMSGVSDKLKKFDYVIWIDADMLMNLPITEKEFFFHDKPMFGVRHPNFLSKRGSFETNPLSVACVKKGEDLSVYIQACFSGGQSKQMLKMVKELEKNTDADLKKGVYTKLQNESYLNKYFIKNKKLFHVYDPTYAYPPSRPLPRRFKRKILHVYNKSFKTNKP